MPKRGVYICLYLRYSLETLGSHKSKVTHREQLLPWKDDSTLQSQSQIRQPYESSTANMPSVPQECAVRCKGGGLERENGGMVRVGQMQHTTGELTLRKSVCWSLPVFLALIEYSPMYIRGLAATGGREGMPAHPHPCGSSLQSIVAPALCISAPHGRRPAAKCWLPRRTHDMNSIQGMTAPAVHTSAHMNGMQVTERCA